MHRFKFMMGRAGKGLPVTAGKGDKDMSRLLDKFAPKSYFFHKDWLNCKFQTFTDETWGRKFSYLSGDSVGVLAGSGIKVGESGGGLGDNEKLATEHWRCLNNRSPQLPHLLRSLITY